MARKLKGYDPATWVNGSEICKYFSISPRHLSQLRKDGVLKANIHFKQVGRKLARRPTYKYHLRNIERDLG